MVTARGYLFIFLNVVRTLSIVFMLLLISSSILSMVKDVEAVNAFIAAGKTNSADNSTLSTTDDSDYIENSTVPNQPAGAFWAVLNWLLIIFQCIVLILSELSFKFADRFFSAYFPVLGPDFGLGALGVIQCLLGAAVLSHHVNEFALVSAFLIFSIGCLNILLGLIFREKAKWKRSITEWRESNKDILPTVDRNISRASGPPTFVLNRNPTLNGYGYNDEKAASGAFRSGTLSSQKSGMGFGRAGEKFAANQGFVVREPGEAVPPYAAKPAPQAKHARFSRASESTRSSYSESQGHNHDEDEGDEHDHSMTRTNSSTTAVDD